MMRRSLLATPVAVAAVLLVGACHRGGSEDVTPSAQPSTATTGAAHDTTAAAAAGMHDSMAGAAGAVHDTAAVKADSAMKHDSM